jgi:hypothetical protein
MLRDRYRACRHARGNTGYFYAVKVSRPPDRIDLVIGQEAEAHRVISLRRKICPLLEQQLTKVDFVPRWFVR